VKGQPRRDRLGIAEETGATVVPPYDHPWILTGQGTAGLELAEQAMALGVTLDAVAAPCSGGGLSTGVALGVKGLMPNAMVHAGEPAGFDDLARSLASGKKETNARLSGSICDALLAPTPGDVTFPLAQKMLGPGVVVTDDEVLDAMEVAFREFKIVVEPGGAVALAAALTGKLPVKGRAVAVICSGGNVDHATFLRALSAPPAGMTLSRRARRDWRIFLWVSLTAAAISAWFGYRVAPDGQPELRSALSGRVASLVIATPILLFLLKGERAGPLRRLRRLPLALYFAAKVLFYFVVIVGGLNGLAVFLLASTIRREFFAFDGVFPRSHRLFVAMAVVGALAAEMSGLLGFGTLKNLLIGRYGQPRREQRAFLLIDMKDSTGVAERLGRCAFTTAERFLPRRPTRRCDCEAEIHKYVGDEAILTWRAGRRWPTATACAAPSSRRTLIEPPARDLPSRYGSVPQFRPRALRRDRRRRDRATCRREIAYVGDTLNVAARLLDAAKELGRDGAGVGRLLKPGGTLPAEPRSPRRCRRSACAAAPRRSAMRLPRRT
jgi:class 3 adenylate cyclase